METFRYKDEKKGREENATRTEYSNERKQWGPIPEPLLGGLHIQRYIDKSVLVENRPLVKVGSSKERQACTTSNSGNIYIM